MAVAGVRLVRHRSGGQAMTDVSFPLLVIPADAATDLVGGAS